MAVWILFLYRRCFLTISRCSEEKQKNSADEGRVLRTIEFYCLLHQLFEVAVDEHQIKDYRNRHCCQFCERYREPDAVDAYQ